MLNTNVQLTNSCYMRQSCNLFLLQWNDFQLSSDMHGFPFYFRWSLNINQECTNHMPKKKKLMIKATIVLLALHPSKSSAAASFGK